MNRALRSIAPCLIAVAGLQSPGFAEPDGSAPPPEPLDARSLLARSFENLFGQGFAQTIELETTSRGQSPQYRKLQMIRPPGGGAGSLLIRFSDPASLRGAAVLVEEHKARQNEHFVFLPAIDRVRRLTAAQRSDSFFGTALSYEDVEAKSASDFDVKALGLGRSAGNPSGECVLLEIRPRPTFESGYDRLKSCIEESTGLIYWTHFFTRGRLVKRLETDLSKATRVGGSVVSFESTFLTPDAGHRTIVRVLDYQSVGDVPGALFSLRNLESGSARKDRRLIGLAPQVTESR